MFPCSELPDLSADCCSQPAPEVLVAEPPCRHRTYHEVLWKCFPRERLLQTLWHGLHFHADLDQRSLGWKVRDLGILALGQTLSLTLETSQVQLWHVLCLGLVQQRVATQPLHSAALHIFTSLQKKLWKKILKYYFFKQNPSGSQEYWARSPWAALLHVSQGRGSASSCLQSWWGRFSEPVCSCCQARTNLHFIQNWMQDQPGKKTAASFKVFQHLGIPCLFGSP